MRRTSTLAVTIPAVCVWSWLCVLFSDYISGGSTVAAYKSLKCPISSQYVHSVHSVTVTSIDVHCACLYLDHCNPASIQCRPTLFWLYLAIVSDSILWYAVTLTNSANILISYETEETTVLLTGEARSCAETNTWPSQMPTTHSFLSLLNYWRMTSNTWNLFDRISAVWY